MTTAPSDKWSDLAVRTGSGAILVALGLWGIWIGGHFFHVMVTVVCGLMIWELTRMMVPMRSNLPRVLGLVAAVAVLIASYLPAGYAMPLLLAPPLIGFGQLPRNRSIFMIFTVMVLLAGFGMMAVRDDLGFWWMLWLVAVVAITDVMGYFAGRVFGGPKFWPKVSPKKTWSGTIGGWVGAGVVGAVFALFLDTSGEIIGFSIALSMASQIGDISESAIKREMGVKDSSSLIPGHGGVLDRFDGMLGASVFLLVVGQLIGFPPGLR